MSNLSDKQMRSALPIPEQAYTGLVKYDAKDPESKFPPIEPLWPPKGGPNVLIYTSIGVEKEILLSILGVRQEYLAASFREMRDQFGDIEAYFSAGLGIDSAGQEALCEQLLEQS